MEAIWQMDSIMTIARVQFQSGMQLDIAIYSKAEYFLLNFALQKYPQERRTGSSEDACLVFALDKKVA